MGPFIRLAIAGATFGAAYGGGFILGWHGTSYVLDNWGNWTEKARLKKVAAKQKVSDLGTKLNRKLKPSKKKKKTSKK